jgi:hypothetical protein
LHDLTELTGLGIMNNQYFFNDTPLLDLEIHLKALKKSTSALVRRGASCAIGTGVIR